MPFHKENKLIMDNHNDNEMLAYQVLEAELFRLTGGLAAKKRPDYDNIKH